MASLIDVGPNHLAAIWYLKKAEVLAGMPDEVLADLESVAVTRRFRKNAAVYAPNDAGVSVLVLLEGRVKVKSLSSDGKETILAFIEAGELFGELALFQEDATYGEYAEAVLPSVIAAVPRNAFLDALRECPEASFRLTKLVGMRKVRIENRVKGMLFRSSRERMLTLLEELAERYGAPNGCGTEITLRLSHQDFASLAGMTRETVTLTLGELQRDRIIRVDRKVITLLAPTEDGATDGRRNVDRNGIASKCSKGPVS